MVRFSTLGMVSCRKLDLNLRGQNQKFTEVFKRAGKTKNKKKKNCNFYTVPIFG